MLISVWQVADFGLSQKRKMGGCGTPCWMRCSGAYGRGVRGAISVYLSEVETKQYPLHLPSLLSMRDSFTSRLTILFDRMLAQQQPTQRQCRARNRTGQCTLTAPHRAVTHTHTHTPWQPGGSGRGALNQGTRQSRVVETLQAFRITLIKVQVVMS